MKKQRKSLFFYIFSFFCAIAVVLTLVRAFSVMESGSIGYTGDEKEIVSDLTYSLNDEWQVLYENGEKESVSLPQIITTEEGQSITLLHDASAFTGKAMQFNLRFYGMQVYLDDELLMQANVSSLNQQLKFAGLQLVKFPETAGSEVKIVLSGSIDGTYDIRNIKCGEYGDLKQDIILNDLPTFILLIIMAVICIALTVASIVLTVLKIMDIRLWDLCSLLLLTIIWGITDSYIPNACGVPMEIAGLFNYLSVIALPIPACIFVLNTVEKNRKIFELLTTLLMCNFGVQTALSYSGVISLDDTWIYQYIFEILLVIVGVDSTHALYIKKKSKDNLLIYIGILFLALLSLLTLLVYWVIGGSSYRYTLLVGLAIFVLLLMSSVIVKYRENYEKSKELIREAVIEKRMAQIDDMTELGNRRSYEEYVKSVWENAERSKNPVVAIMDINNLKQINDEFGHAAGDDYIRAAAKVIREVYEPHALCFRLGGDEFGAVFQDMVEEKDYYPEKLQEAVDRYNKNSTYKLAIAVGQARIFRGNGTKKELAKWRLEADMKMYEKKRAMKAGK